MPSRSVAGACSLVRSQLAGDMHEESKLRVRRLFSSRKTVAGEGLIANTIAIAGFRDFDLRASCIGVCRSFKDEGGTLDYTVIFRATLGLLSHFVDRFRVQEAERDQCGEGQG